MFFILFVKKILNIILVCLLYNVASKDDYSSFPGFFLGKEIKND